MADTVEKVKVDYPEPETEGKPKEDSAKFEKVSRQLDLSEEEKDSIVKKIVADQEHAAGSSATWRANITKWYDQYYGVMPAAVDPWVGAANVSTHLTASVVDRTHASLLSAAWNEDTVNLMSQDPADKPNLDVVNRLMEFAFKKEMDMFPSIDQFIQNGCVTGTAVAELKWKEEWKWVERTIREPESKSSKSPAKVTHKKGYMKLERGECEVFDASDFYMPPFAKSVQSSPWVIRVLHMYPATVKEWAKRGFFLPLPDDFDARLYAAKHGEAELTKARRAGIDLTQSDVMYQLIPIYAWYGGYDYNKDDIPEECVFYIIPETGVFLRSALNYLGRRPFVVWNYSPRPGNAMGEGLPEKMDGLQREINIIHNQRLNASSISIIPFGFYRAASGFQPATIELAPGVFIPVDDINDVKIAQFNGNFTVSFQEERVALEYLDRLTATGPYQQGQESPVVGTRATATGTLALIGQANQRYDIIIRRLLRAINEMVELSLVLYQLNLPPGMAERVVGRDGEKLFAHLSREQIQGLYDNHIPTDSLSANKALDRQVKMLAYNMLINNPIVQSDPRHVWEVTADAMKSIGMADVERLLGSKPKGAEGEARDPEDELHLMNQGQEVNPNISEDLLGHLVAHLAQRNSNRYKEMAPEHRRLLDDHIEQTKRFYRLSLVIQEKMALQAGAGVGSPSPALDQALALAPQGGGPTEAAPPTPEGPEPGAGPVETPGGGRSGLLQPPGIPSVGGTPGAVSTPGIG